MNERMMEGRMEGRGMRSDKGGGGRVGEFQAITNEGYL